MSLTASGVVVATVVAEMECVLMENRAKSQTIFKKAYGSQTNFMTPNVLEHGMATANLAWELSEGTGIGGGNIYGVTVIERIWGKPTNRRHDLSQSFETEHYARRHIKALGKGV